jgi:hypothetical protein
VRRSIRISRLNLHAILLIFEFARDDNSRSVGADVVLIGAMLGDHTSSRLRSHFGEGDHDSRARDRIDRRDVS